MSHFQVQPPSDVRPHHTVLIVDDDAATVGLLAEILETEDFEVWKAFTAKEARAVLAERQPELVLLDVKLPDEDGRNLCHWIKSDARFDQLFVILISGLEVGVQSRITGLNLGADEYLTKPIQPLELIARLRSFLRIREAAEALRRANERLEERVLERTEELRLANGQLKQAAEELRTLTSRLLETQERERRRLAHELHDEAGQALTVLKFSFDNIEEVARTLAPEPVADGRAALTRLTQLIRNLWQELRPAMLEDFGLVPALIWYFDRYTPSTRVRVDFQHESVDGRRFDRAVETAAYRTVQECLTNVARHAGVLDVRVVVWAGPDLLQVQIIDQGCGFDTSGGLSRNGSCGLVGMQERVRQLHGTWSVITRLGAGTRITAEFPLTEPKAVAPNGFSTMDTQMLRPSDFAAA
ncbi:MAG: response regulator [Proteobacteria bacterium]|nr:response regulator [Pseudomonadota bacterium]